MATTAVLKRVNISQFCRNKDIVPELVYMLIDGKEVVLLQATPKDDAEFPLLAVPVEFRKFGDSEWLATEWLPHEHIFRWFAEKVFRLTDNIQPAKQLVNIIFGHAPKITID